MLIVQDAVWNRVSKNRERKIATRYYCDEFHLLLKEKQTAIYSVEIWKRFRKWGGIPTGLTQNVGDFLKSEEIEGILAPEGTGYRAKTRFAKFFNLPELISLFKESADIQTPDMLKLPVPEAEYENVVLKPSEYQKEMVQSLADRAEAVRDRKVRTLFP